MRKYIIYGIMLVLGLGNVSAQDVNDLGIFNHLGVGAGVGTTGVSVEVAAPVTQYVAVRGGVNIVPSFKFETGLDIYYDKETIPVNTHILKGANDMAEDHGQVEPNYNIPSDVDIDAKTSLTTGHLLFDVFPFKNSSFHLTAGAYFGSSKIISVYNQQPGVLSGVVEANETLPPDKQIGYKLGDYVLTPTPDGNLNGYIKVSGFRPYLGIGFGRPVPMNHRVTCNFDMGVQFWGAPKVYTNGGNGEVQLTESNTGGDSGFLKFISKVSVWPVLNLRVAVRLF